MKKFLLCAVIVALLLPAAAFAATEFTLGGFVKLDAFWDSTQTTKNMLTPIARGNDPNFHHGRMKFTAQGSRFNLTIKGPDLWGAKTSGFIEMDFDSEQELGLGSANAQSASNNYKPRLRHAMFRFNWPDTELLFGQYWSFFCEMYPESVQDGPFQGHGMPTARLPQIRVTQKFGDGWSVAGLVGEPNNVVGGGPTYSIPNSGEAAETPQVQGQLKYAKDLWGKAAFYGAPKPFTASIQGGWQRASLRANNALVPGQTFGQTGFAVPVGRLGWHQTVNPWMVLGNVFLPVIPTTSANLAGTASISAQAYVGQGTGAFGEGLGADVLSQWVATFSNGVFGNDVNFYDQQLYKQYGGYVQAQYYFTNQWFANVAAGYSKIYGVSQSSAFQLVSAANPFGTVWAGADKPKSWLEVDATLWYRPIQAIKFGLQYSYQRTDWLQGTIVPAGVGNYWSDTGIAHRVEFVGFFYF
jgi:hypothetical protein